MRKHSSYSRVIAVTALVVATFLSNSCGGPTDPSDNVIDTFTGTITMGAGNAGIHTFVVSNNGELFATLISLTPPLSSSAKYAAIWLGTSGSGGCTWDGPQTNLGRPGTVLTNSVRSGTFCVAVIDKGDFTADETYEIRVSHP